MAKYLLRIESTCLSEVEIEAESAEDAEAKWSSADYYMDEDIIDYIDEEVTRITEIEEDE